MWGSETTVAKTSDSERPTPIRADNKCFLPDISKFYSQLADEKGNDAWLMATLIRETSSQAKKMLLLS